MAESNVNSWFAETYKPELYKVLTDLSKDEVKTVVAVARKGPRVLEVIQKVWPEKGSLLLKKVISDKAIPFSAEHFCNNRYLIFDDILIYGSTFIDVYKAVNYVSGNGTDSNMSPPGLILAFDNKTKKVKVEDLNLEKLPSIRRMEPNEITGFSAQVVEAFYYLGKPFDMEHPIIELPLKMNNEEDVEKILTASNLNYCNLTSTLQRNIGMLYFSVEIPRNLWIAWEKIVDNSTIEVESVKVRLYFDFVNKIVRLMPLVIFSISADSINPDKKEKGLFIGRFKFFDDLIKEAKTRVSGKPKQKEEAILRLINFLLAYIEGVNLIQLSNLKHLFNGSNLNPKINSFDLQILFGFEFGNYLYEKLMNNSTFSQINLVSPHEKSIDYKQITEVSKSLLAKIKSLLKIERLKEKYPFVDEPYSALKAIVDAMRIMDRETRRGEYEPDRLKFGFSFNDLLYIIENEFGIIYDPFSISVALDYYIDRGVIIPIFIKDEENKKWYRVFRFGEAYADKMAFLIKHVIELSKLRTKTELASTDFEKLLTFIAIICNRINITDLDYITKSDLRGDRPYIELIYGNEPKDRNSVPLIDWCKKHHVIQINRMGEGKPSYVNVYPDFPYEKDIWSEGGHIEPIKNALNFGLDAFNLKLDNISKEELRLALTTCYNEQNTIKAIKYELISWFEGIEPERTNFRLINNLFKELNYKFEEKHLIAFVKLSQREKEVILNQSKSNLEFKNLYDFIVKLYGNTGKVDENITEAYKKLDTFKKLKDIRDSLEENYSDLNSDEKKALLAPYYREHIRKIIDPRIDSSKILEWDDINVLLILCNKLTSLTRTFLSEKGFVEGDKSRKISEELEKYNNTVEEYNNKENQNVNFQLKIIKEECIQKITNLDLKISFNSFINMLDILYRNLYEFYEKRAKNINFDSEAKLDVEIPKLLEGTDIQADVLKKVLEVAHEISQEGREGKKVGTAFVVGDTNTVLQYSNPLIRNPFKGYIDEEKLITDKKLKETIKAYAQLDGVFIVHGHGVVEGAGIGITADQSKVDIEEGLGTRHKSVAAATLVTKAIGIVISESGGIIRIFKNGKIESKLNPMQTWSNE